MVALQLCLTPHDILAIFQVILKIPMSTIVVTITPISKLFFVHIVYLTDSFSGAAFLPTPVHLRPKPRPPANGVRRPPILRRLPFRYTHHTFRICNFRDTLGMFLVRPYHHNGGVQDIYHRKQSKCGRFRYILGTIYICKS